MFVGLGVFVLGSAVAELAHTIDEPEAFALASGAAEPGVVLAAVVSVAGGAGPQADGDTPVPFGVSVPASAVLVGVDSSGRPRFHAFPNVGHHAISSSCVEGVGEESFHSSSGVRTNRGVCSIPSSLGLHQNKSLEHGCNKPNPGHNNVSDTSDLPKDATTTHSRKTNPPLRQGQRKHRARQG